MKQFKVRDLIDAGSLEINDGYRAKNEELGRPGLPFARAANIDGDLTLDSEAGDCLAQENVPRVGAKLSRPADVVLTTKGSVGRVAFVRPSHPPFVYSPQLSFWRVIDRSIVSPRYLYFWMRGKEARDQLVSLKGQTDMADYVSLIDQRNMNLSLPSIDRQEAVAAVLGALDDKIEVNRELGACSSQIAGSLGQRVRESATSVAQLGDVAEINARTLSVLDPTDPIAYVDISSVKVGKLLASQTMSRRAAPGRARRLVAHEDILWSMVRPNLRSFLFVLNPPPNMVVSTGFAVVTARRVPASYLFVHLTSNAFVKFLTALADGSAYPAVPVERFGEAKIPLPDEATLLDFAARVQPIFDLVASLDSQSRKLAEVRDLLLPKLISGEIRPNDAGLTVTAM